MDQFDYSGNLYAFGEIHQQTPSQIVLSKDRETLDTLAELLADDRNFLSLEPTTAKSLAFLLKQQRNSETIAQVETQLREHFLSVYQDYGVAQRNSGKNNLHEQKILELAQLSAFFGLWADTANFIAQIRTERPDIWQATLPTLLYQDSSNLDSDTRELISYRLETLKEISEVTAFF